MLRTWKISLIIWFRIFLCCLGTVGYVFPFCWEVFLSSRMQMEELNLIFCELIALTLNASGRLPQKRKGRMLSSASWTERVTEYIIGRLRTTEGSVDRSSTPITPAAYHALLPTIWAFITSPTSSPHQSEELIHATLDHALKVAPKSACKRLTLEFVGRLMLVRSFHWCTTSILCFYNCNCMDSRLARSTITLSWKLQWGQPRHQGEVRCMVFTSTASSMGNRFQ